MNLDTHACDSNRLNWKQACSVLGCSRTKFYRMVQDGLLPAYKVGSRGLWVKKEDCEKVVKRHETQSTQK